MQLPSFKRILVEDFPKDFKELVTILAGIINNNTDLLYQAMSRRLSLADNLLCDLKTVVVIVGSNGVPTSKTFFKITNPYLINLKGVQVIRVENLTSALTFPTDGVTVTYVEQNSSNQINQVNSTTNSGISSTVDISHVTGLVAGHTYRLTVIAWG